MGRDTHKHRNEQGNKTRLILVELGGMLAWGRVVLSLYVSRSHRWVQEEGAVRQEKSEHCCVWSRLLNHVS